MAARHSWPLLAAACWLVGAQSAFAVEMPDRLEVHGAYETQVRSIVRDFSPSEDWDLSQWWHVLGLELEVDVAPTGWGPFDSIDLFARAEVRFDCVWTQACTLFHAADTYRLGHSRRLPKRLVGARRTGYRAGAFLGDRRNYHDIPFYAVESMQDGRLRRPPGSRNAMQFWQTPLGIPWFGATSYGPDRLAGTIDDPTIPIFFDLLTDHCNEWGARHVSKGSENGRSPGQTLLLQPACKFDSIGAIADQPNPFRAKDLNPHTLQAGSGARPYRPAPDAGFRAATGKDRARGLYYPNARLARLLAADDLDRYRPFLRRAELAWNHGQAQSALRELKELYVDVEMFDHRLWLRVGYQTIVWGETELFRLQDRINPQDLALTSLPTLEESRLSLWAARGVWSFGTVGGFQDVRAEVALVLDDYEPNDIGTCGEPYTVLAACRVSTDLVTHGWFGEGLAGARWPEPWWENARHFEVAARVEWRWDRFHFSISDFYGYRKSPYVEQIFAYSRNVDPRSGRPREGEAQGACTTGREPACLRSGEALERHHANQQRFAVACAATMGSVAIDPSGCFADMLGSSARTGRVGEAVPRLSVAFTMIGGGDGVGESGVLNPLYGEFNGRTLSQVAARKEVGTRKVTASLNRDSGDGPIDLPRNHPLTRERDYPQTVRTWIETFGGSLADKLTDSQEAVLGCGPVYGTSCDVDGVDLLNAEASAIFQSWASFEGTFRGGGAWDTLDTGQLQPGTVGFLGGPVCTRQEGGRTFVLPGCRGPSDRGYDASEDGTIDGLRHPFTGQQFRNELAAYSWNLQMAFVAISGTDASLESVFDPNDPFRADGCSFRHPQLCSGVAAFEELAGVGRATLRAGGNSRFGRRDFVWHGGSVGVLRADRTNVLGIATSFPETHTGAQWSIEGSWEADVPLGDFDARDGTTDVDIYRLAIAATRPTYLPLFNRDRNFLFYTEWLIEYVAGHEPGFSSEGPWQIVGMLAVSTGYYQDRLLASVSLVHFFGDHSSAVIPQVTWRLTDALSATVGIAAFAGRSERRVAPIQGPRSPRFGRHADTVAVENALSLVRDRDEVWLKVRYAF